MKLSPLLQVDKVNNLDLAQDYVSCLIALLHLMNDDHYTSYMEPLTEHNLIVSKLDPVTALSNFYKFS